MLIGAVSANRLVDSWSSTPSISECIKITLQRNLSVTRRNSLFDERERLTNDIVQLWVHKVL